MSDPRVRVIRRGGDGNDETSELLRHLDEVTVQVRLLGAQPGWAQQLIAEALIDLLSRVFRRIDVRCAAGARSDDRLPPGPLSLVDRLRVVRSHGQPPAEPGVPDVVVAVGVDPGLADLHLDGDGWQAYVGTEASRLGETRRGHVPFGPLAAACRGAAHVFNLALRDLRPTSGPPRSAYSSALNYFSSSEPLARDEPEDRPALEAVLVGLGSVGGAAAYTFARCHDLAGVLHLVDPQTLVDHNFDRALLATAEASAAGRAKVEVAAAALDHLPSLTVRQDPVDLSRWIAARPASDALPLILSAVDSREQRRAIQDCLPLRVLNAACNPLDSVVSGHVTGAGPCLMCLFMKDWTDKEQARFKMIADATRLPAATVIELLHQRVPLEALHLTMIEQRLGWAPGALGEYRGCTLEQLWDRQFVYGGAEVATAAGAVVAVAAPWVTAMSGVLLAGEACKASTPALAAQALGPGDAAPGIRYTESVYGSPLLGQITDPPRWGGHECLCNSPRRRRLIVGRYGLKEDDYLI